MRKLRVGVWLGEGYKPEAGGGFGYYTQLIGKIKSHPFTDTTISFVTNNNAIKSDVNCYKIQWRPMKQQKLRSLLHGILSWTPFMGKLNTALSAYEKRHALKLNEELNKVADILYYPTPECVYPDFPYIYTLWDSGHLSAFPFPEVSPFGEFEQRKAHYEVCLNKAQLIFVESEAGKKEVEHFYRIPSKRIRVVPIFPSPIVEDSYSNTAPKGLTENSFFIHYPAQFWAHKNHYNLILAFKKALASYPDLKLVFTGSDKGNKAYLFSLISELGIGNNIVDLGFVSMEELKWLYLHSKGLVMASLLGPTNMPLLEAAELGCPVACANMEGQIEQLGEYGYYFDGTDPDNIAQAISEMLSDNKRGIKKTYIKKFTIGNALSSIEKAFTEIQRIRFTWE